MKVGISLRSDYRIFAHQTNRPISLTPWSITMNTFSSNVGNVSLWRSIRWVPCAWGDIDLGQLVQQLGGTTFGNSGTAIDHKIIIQSIRLSTSHDWERDPGIALNILQFFMELQVTRDNFIAIKANPDDRHMRTAILVQGHNLSGMPAVNAWRIASFRIITIRSWICFRQFTILVYRGHDTILVLFS